MSVTESGDWSGDALLSAIVKGNPVATFVLNAGGEVTHWNRACELLTGVQANQVLGTRQAWSAFYTTERPVLADLVLKAGHEQHEALDLAPLFYTRFHTSESVEHGIEAEDFFPHMGPKGRWLYFTAAPLYNADGQLCGAIETLQDVTERHAAHAALQDSRDHLAQIVDGSAVATFVLDADHVVTHWNRACEALTGVSAQTMVGTRQQWRAFDDQPRPVLADWVVDGLDEAEMSSHYDGNCRASAVLPGGFEAEGFFPALGDAGQWLFFTAAPLYDTFGRVVGAVETLQDVSARKQAELALLARE